MIRCRLAFVAIALALILWMPHANAVTFGAATFSPASGSVTSIDLSAAGSNANDVLVAVLAVRRDAASTITPPAGWALVYYTNTSTIGLAVYRFTNSGPGASHSWTISPAANAAGSLLSYRGVDTANAINFVGTALEGSGTTVTAPQVTTTRANTMLIGIFAVARGNAAINPSPMTTSADDVMSGNTNSDITLEVAEAPQPTASATGAKTASSSRNNPNLGLLLALSPPTVSFDTAATSGTESSTPANLGVALSGASSMDTTVNYAVTGGTATGGGTDYTLLGTGTLTIAAGATAGTIQLTIVNDSLGESGETVTVTLSSPANAVLGTTPAHAYTILNDDPVLQVAADPVNAAGAAQIGASWGGWLADPGATDVVATNYLKITNIGVVSTQGVTIDFSNTTFAASSDPLETIALDGNIRFASFEDTSPGTTAPNQGTYSFGSVSASGSVTLAFTGSGNILYVAYRLDSLPSLLSDQDYRASYTASAV